jgi:hypothetical protein
VSRFVLGSGKLFLILIVRLAKLGVRDRIFVEVRRDHSARDGLQSLKFQLRYQGLLLEHAGCFRGSGDQAKPNQLV